MQQFSNQELLYKLSQLNTNVTKLSDELLLKEFSITYQQFLILRSLTIQNNSSQAEIANRLTITQAAISRHIDTLALQKLLVRQESSVSRREFSIQLTPKGQDKITKAFESLTRFRTFLLENITDLEKSVLDKALDKIIERVSHYR